MCGIIGIVAKEPFSVKEKLLRSLKRLEYRGYDSIGFATKEGELKKDIRYIDAFIKKTNPETKTTLAISHTTSETISHNIASQDKLRYVPGQDVMNILNFIEFENYYCQVKVPFQDLMKKKVNSCSKTAKTLGVSYMTLQRILTVRKYWMSFKTLLALSEVLEIERKEVFSNILYIKTKNSFPISFNVKNLTSPSFFRVLGHILGDGGIHVVKNEGKYRAFYVNNEEVLLNSFSLDIKNLFGEMRLYKRKRENHGDEIWLPTTIGFFFYKTLKYDKLPGKRVPTFILKSENGEFLSAFLQAIYDDEGTISVDKHEIVLSLGNEELLKEIRSLVDKIGIKCNKIYKIIPKNRSIMYRFSVTSKNNILDFAQKVGFLHPMKKERLKTLVKKYTKVK